MNFNEEILQYEERVTLALRALYHRYGYAQYRMSKFEEYDLYVQNKDFLVSDHVITFTDTNGRLMALKPDVTLSIVRNTRDVPGGVQKLYYNENVYRVTQRSRAFREQTQVGLECIGNVDDYHVTEVLLLAMKSLRCVSDDYRLVVSHLGILSDAVDALGLPAPERQQVLQFAAQKNLHEIAQVCARGGADPDACERLRRLLVTDSNADAMLPVLRALSCDEAAVSRLERMIAVMRENGFQNRISLDFSLAGNLHYYNGIVFQGFVSGVPSCVLSGGQYDNLMRKMGRRSDAIGFAVYLDELERLGKMSRSDAVDAVLLYDEGADAVEVCRAVRRLTEDGMSVTAQTCVPEKLPYKKLLRLSGSEVTVVEAHA
jgi:ATP phosphoribosyltransferase regulatory subunit